jgi:outer membrane immunogenic protein
MKLVFFAAALLSSTSAFAQDEAGDKIGGFRVEGHLGIERPNLNERDGGTTYVAELGSSVAYGAEIGYDIPVSATVTVGPYVSYDLSDSEKCESGILSASTRFNACFTSKSDLSVGVRGAVTTGKGEVYGGLGYDVADVDLNIVLTPTVGAPTTIASTKSRKGVGISFGYNHTVAKNIYLGLGMRVSEFGTFENTDSKLQRFQGHVNVGFRF